MAIVRLATGISGGGVTISGTGRQYENNVVLVVDEPVPFGNKTITLGIDVSKIIAIGWESDKALTMTTNDDGDPDDSFTLVANTPVIWASDFPAVLPCPLTVDIVTFKLVNAVADTTARFKLVALMDLD
jgi:hypothetical protein